MTRTFRVATHRTPIVALFAAQGAIHEQLQTINTDTAADELWWIPQDNAHRLLSSGVELPQLTAPDPGWIAALDESWTGRPVGTLRKGDVAKFYAKHPDRLDTDPEVVLSIPGENTELRPPELVAAADLANGEMPGHFNSLPGHCMVQLDGIAPCVVEGRFWITDGKVTAAAPYRIGTISWGSSLFLEVLTDSTAVQLLESALDTAERLASEIDGPPGYAVDIGGSMDGQTPVLRAWPAWAADPLSADPAGVYAALEASHDFNGDHDRWRWLPDPAVYDRSLLFPAPQQPQTDQPETETTDNDDAGEPTT